MVPPAGSVFELAMKVPYLYSSSFTSLAYTAELVLLMGARHTDEVRKITDSDFQMIAEALGHSITAANPHATSLASKLLLMESEVRRMQPPHQHRPRAGLLQPPLQAARHCHRP